MSSSSTYLGRRSVTRPASGARYTPAGVALHQLLREVERVARAELAGSRPSASRIALLQALRQGPKTASALARERGASRQSVQRVASSMLADGWIARAQNPRDRRAPLLALTPHGARVLESAAVARASALSRIAEHFELAELSSATRVLRALRVE